MGDCGSENCKCAVKNGKCDYCGVEKEVHRHIFVENENEVHRILFICDSCKIDVLESALTNMFESEIHMNSYLMDIYDKVLCDKLAQERLDNIGEIKQNDDDIILEMCRNPGANLTQVEV